MLLKNLIKNISKDKGRKIISGLSTDSEKLKKILFLLLKEINQMVRILLKTQLQMELQLLCALKIIKLNIKTL